MLSDYKNTGSKTTVIKIQIIYEEITFYTYRNCIVLQLFFSKTK
jgi:hypothetical protein